MQHHIRRFVQVAAVAMAAAAAVVGIRSKTAHPRAGVREHVPFDPELHMAPPFAPLVGLARGGKAEVAHRGGASRARQAAGLRAATPEAG